MPGSEPLDLETFTFRGLHPYVFLGTASDRYAGWIGQIYSPDRYLTHISRRRNTIGGGSFVEEVLPVDSVKEYFTHFRLLELDFTFYRVLLEPDGRPTQNFHTLRAYREHMKDGDLLILKVPQAVFAQKLLRQGKYIENSQYLDPEVFSRQFYEPAVGLLGPSLAGFVFEQEYQRREGRPSLEQVATQMDAFFGTIPKDDRYHIELRTEGLLAPRLFEVMIKHGVGQVLSHWTWLPSLRAQFLRSDNRFVNSGGQCIIRLLTPRGMRYEDAYAKAHPFNRLVEGMMDPRMVEETAGLISKAVDQKVRINVIVNNRAGGNAPLISQHIARRFLSQAQMTSCQKT